MRNYVFHSLHPKPDWRAPSGYLVVGPSQSRRRSGRRGAPPDDLEWLRNGALPPAAPDRSFSEHPHGGPWSRVFVTGAARTIPPCFHTHGSSGDFSRATGRGGFPTELPRLTLAWPA